MNGHFFLGGVCSSAFYVNVMKIIGMIILILGRKTDMMQESLFWISLLGRGVFSHKEEAGILQVSKASL